jgi:hypothetical protein
MRSVVAALMLVVAPLASAQYAPAPPPPGPLAPSWALATERGLVLDLRTDFGTEELFEVGFSDGSTQSMNLGQGFTAAAGLSFLPFAGGHLATRATLGFMFTSMQASNGDAWLWSFPLEITQVLYIGPLRLGAGPSFLLSPGFTGSDFFGDLDYDFGPVAPGFVFEAEWVFAKQSRTGIGFRSSVHRFDVNGVSVDAPSFGFVLRADFDLAQ